MKNSVAVVYATIFGFVASVATFTVARREFAKELLSNIEATALWKENDSISGAMIHSHVIDQLNNENNAAALQALCSSLHQDLRNLEDLKDLAELSERNGRRASALSKGHATYKQWCVKPHA